MRIAQFLGAIGAASVVIAASSGEPSISTGRPLARSRSIPSALQSDITSLLNSEGSVNATTPLTTTTSPTTTPNTTTSHTAELTGGAIPQQMQASMAGLLGFCIMGLVML